MQESDAFQLAGKHRDKGVGQRRDAILFALAIPNGDCFVVEVDILDPQAEALHTCTGMQVQVSGAGPTRRATGP